MQGSTNKPDVREAATMSHPASWLLTLKVVSVTWSNYVLILVSVLDLGPMYATDFRRASSLNAPALGARA